MRRSRRGGNGASFPSPAIFRAMFAIASPFYFAFEYATSATRPVRVLLNK
jgi:hypothetical protein